MKGWIVILICAVVFGYLAMSIRAEFSTTQTIAETVNNAGCK